MSPIIVKILAGLLVLVGIFGLGYLKGGQHVQAAWDADHQKQELALAKANERAAQVTERVVTKYVDRVQVVREKAQTIVKEVPVYVTPESDSRCIVPVGFVRLHDGAAANQPPGAPDEADGAASGVALSAVAETVAGNYGTYHEVAEQLKALQEWVREQYGTEPPKKE